MMIRIFLILYMLTGFMPRLDARPDTRHFPLPASLESRVRFWVDVYTRYSATQYLVFDEAHPERIFRVCDLKAGFPDGVPSRKEKEVFLKAERDKTISTLVRLAEKKSAGGIPDAEELRLARLFPDSVRPEQLLLAAQRIRLQHGGLESFYEGLVRSGRYMDSLRILFKRRELPEELAYLPHVESSFNIRAVSPAGAVGLWQFIPSTGGRYLRIDIAVDERKDPYDSGEAAARLLKLHFDSLGSWPLAITAYNYGLAGIRRIVRETGTKDLAELISRVQKKAFGFSTKNFYAEFIAAAIVAENPKAFFPDFAAEPPWRFKIVECPIDLPMNAVIRAFNLSDSVFAEWNPSLTAAVHKGHRPIPKGFHLRIPEGADETAAFEVLASEKIIPKGSYWAWCTHPGRLFHFVDKTYFYFPARKGKAG